MHTGGTSGKSKAVLLTNDNLNSMVHAQRVTAKNFAEGDVMLTIMPVFHGFGLCSSVHMPLSYGVSVVLWPKFESKKLKLYLMIIVIDSEVLEYHLYVMILR